MDLTPGSEEMLMSVRSRFAHLAALALVAALTSACFSSQTVIKLRPDGSGTIEQTNLVNAAMIGMAAGMAQSMAGDKTSGAQLPKTDDLFSEEQLKKQAAQLGEGVKFVSSEKVTQNGMQGARAVYSFDRVDQLTMGSSRASRASSTEGAPTGNSATPQMQFAFAKSGPDLSRLTVSFPDPKRDATPAEPTPTTPKAMPDMPPEALAMMRSMFEGARLGVEVEVEGRIIKTNAPATSGARATLIEVDFGQLLADPARFQALQSLKPGTDFETVRKALADAKGVKIPLASQVTIDFMK
jgi:hypothetical protein